MLEDLAVHPATGRHLATKLATHFVSEAPDPDLVGHMAAAYRDSGGELMALYRGLLEHPAAWRDFGAKVKTPLEFMVTAVRALGVRSSDLAGVTEKQIRKFIHRPLARMGQPYAQPSGPDGWPEEADAWINPPSLAARIAWGAGLAKTLKIEVPDPRSFVTAALGAATGTRLLQAAHGAETKAEGLMLVLASARTT